MFDLIKIPILILKPTKDGWANNNLHITIKIINGVPLLTTPHITDQALYWDDRVGYKHWSCEIPYDNNHQYRIFIPSLIPGVLVKMYGKTI